MSNHFSKRSPEKNLSLTISLQRGIWSSSKFIKTILYHNTIHYLLISNPLRLTGAIRPNYLDFEVIALGNRRWSFLSILKLQLPLGFILVIVAVGIIVLLENKYSSFNLSGRPRLDNGVPAPNFTLPGLDGKMANLADYKGEVVLLNIWATWCPPCVEEMPSMEKLYQELKENN